MELTFKSAALIPPGGWYFIEFDGTKIESHSPRDLIIKVAKYRGSNGINPGDPTEEVTAQLCHRWPTGCNGHPSRYIPIPTDWMPMAQKFVRIIHRLRKTGVELVGDDESDNRASICSECPFNIPSYQARGSCKSCGKGIFNQIADGAVAIIRNAVIGAKKTTYQERLKTCGKCGCDLKFKVWLPKSVLEHTPEELEVFPNFCWLK